MAYRINVKNGAQIFPLGYGCMRFPKDDGALKEQLKLALDGGVNYFDTAYVYPGSEARLGAALKALGAREKINVATKMPPYFVSQTHDFDKIFDRQLSRLKTDYIDYYMLHMLTEKKTFDRLAALNLKDWVKNKKETGQIKNFGFSFHGGRADFFAVLEAYDWDFTMIQYNYYDEHNQAGRAGLEKAAEMGVPVIIMEPLRGGMLVKGLPKDALNIIENAYIKRTPAEWGLRWVYNHPEPLTVLSGMSSQIMIEENLKIANDAAPGALTERDFEVYKQLTDAINAKIKVACTGCSYCMPCPSGVDIPMCFSCYNEKEVSGAMRANMNYIIRANGHEAGLCVNCGMCARKCPQNINIPAELKNVKKAMEGLFYKPIRALARKAMKLNQ